MSLLGKKILDTSTIGKCAVVVDGESLNNYYITDKYHNQVMMLTVGVTPHTPSIVCYSTLEDAEANGYLVYSLHTDYKLDSYTTAHILRLLSGIIYTNTGLTIELVGLYFHDEILGHGVIDDHKLTRITDARFGINKLNMKME